MLASWSLTSMLYWSAIAATCGATNAGSLPSASASANDTGQQESRLSLLGQRGRQLCGRAKPVEELVTLVRCCWV